MIFFAATSVMLLWRNFLLGVIHHGCRRNLSTPTHAARSLRIEIKREALTSAPQILIIFLSFLCIERTFTRALVSERTFGELTHILIEQGYKFQRLMEIDDVSPFAQKPQLSSSNAIFN